jgi:murein L,D-transpeptidase YafK
MKRGALIAKAFIVLLGALCVLDVVQAPRRGVVLPATDHVLVDKSERRLTLFKNGRILRSYDVALGRGGPGDKEREGDSRVPEGHYRIVGRNPDSAYHLSLRISYPTPEQAARAQAHGIDPGGDIMIHGIRNGLGWIGPLHRLADWTQGCIAVTDQEIEEVWTLVPDWTTIEIRE